MNATIPASPPPPHVRHTNPVLAFVIGLSIILLASILSAFGLNSSSLGSFRADAAGLNLSKYDHVRMSAVPKAQRGGFRPLWALGMLLYILSQVLGSTLALEYMRAEYVAPLGSSSLVFNFLFARFLVGTQVTKTDIYGTIVVILGVIGIVAFGSINSGLGSETDVDHLTALWRRGGWLGYFFVMSFSLIFLIVATYRLDAVLAARADLDSDLHAVGRQRRVPRSQNAALKMAETIRERWDWAMGLLTEWLVYWTEPKDETTIAWTLGIGWACCGGGLAGGCLVFAKATVKLISGSLSHENAGNQLGHAAPIFTILLLAATAVMQIICLNRGLAIYDSTLVVPVFYGVYTAAGWLNSLIFNNEVDSYQPWTLFLIFVSIFVLISGVVLLTHKKPDPGPLSTRSTVALGSAGIPRMRQRPSGRKAALAGDPASAEEGERVVGSDQEVLWGIGDASDEEDVPESDDEGLDEDVDHHQHPLSGSGGPPPANSRNRGRGEEGHSLLHKDDDDDLEAPAAAHDPFNDRLEHR